MAPQASLVATSTLQFSPFPTPTSADASPKPWVPIPVALLIFLGLCLAYTVSYFLYRFVMSRRHESEEDVPDHPDRGVSQFMNGARLTLNFGHKFTPTLDESPQTPEEKKPLTDPLHPVHSENPTSSPAESSSTPFIILTPSFAMHFDEALGKAQFLDQGPIEPGLGPSMPPLALVPPFSQRVAAKVKFLSRDRAEAIALDPKLAPVQGPLRPLSMVQSPSRKRWITLFGLGFRHGHGHSGNPGTDSAAQ